MSPPPHAAIAALPLREDELTIGGWSASELAARVGRTPFYAYDRERLRQRVDELRAALPAAVSLHYAMKANPMPALVGFMVPLVDGLDVASGGELRVALDAGMAPQEISFAGPGKSLGELEQAAAAGILVNVESEREVRLLEQISARQGRAARVAVRVNPDFELKSSAMKMGGGPKPFGIDAERVPEVLADIGRRGLAFEGFHIFSGSQILRAEAICEAQSRALSWLCAWRPMPRRRCACSTWAAASGSPISRARCRSSSRPSARTSRTSRRWPPRGCRAPS